jgi:hypothetical protein
VFHVLGVGRHDHLHEVLGPAVARLALDQHLVDIAVVEVADRAVDQVAFLVDQRGRDGFQRQFAHLLPLALEIFVVALDLGLGALGPCRTHDQARALRHVERCRDFLELLAVGGVGDLAGDPAAPGGVGHQHAVAAREAEIGRERRTLVAAFLLDDLHQHDLADLHDLLDLVLPRARLAHGADVFLGVVIGHGFGGGRVVLCGFLAVLVALVVTVILVGGIGPVLAGFGRIVFGLRGRAVFGRLGRVGCLGGLRGFGRVVVLGLVEIDHVHARGRAAGHRISLGRLGLGAIGLAAAGTAALGLSLLLGLGGHGLGIFTLLGQQRLPVGDRDLVVVGMDFGKREEAVAVAAVIHEGGLQRRFDPRHLRQIDISRKLPLAQRLEVELLDLGSVNHDNPGLLGVRGIDKHLLCHVVLARRPPGACARGASRIGRLRYV